MLVRPLLDPGCPRADCLWPLQSNRTENILGERRLSSASLSPWFRPRVANSGAFRGQQIITRADGEPRVRRIEKPRLFLSTKKKSSTKVMINGHQQVAPLSG